MESAALILVRLSGSTFCSFTPWASLLHAVCAWDKTNTRLQVNQWNFPRGSPPNKQSQPDRDHGANLVMREREDVGAGIEPTMWSGFWPEGSHLLVCVIPILYHYSVISRQASCGPAHLPYQIEYIELKLFFVFFHLVDWSPGHTSSPLFVDMFSLPLPLLHPLSLLSAPPDRRGIMRL